MERAGSQQSQAVKPDTSGVFIAHLGMSNVEFVLILPDQRRKFKCTFIGMSRKLLQDVSRTSVPIKALRLVLLQF
jgi:hypothetical protein